MDLNRVMLIGNVTRDPEVRTTPSGQTVASLSIATNRVWKDKDGNKQQKAEFHNIVAWRRLGEIVGQYVKKGSKIYLEGHLETRNWDDQNGVKRYRTEIIADNMIMLDRSSAAPVEPAPAPEAPVQSPAPDPDEISIEDIPF